MEILNEINLLINVCNKIKIKKKLCKKERKFLSQIFFDRFKKAMKIIENKSIIRYTFNPSNRVVWSVKGKREIYQVMSNMSNLQHMSLLYLNYRL